jgi:hypothetical protein
MKKEIKKTHAASRTHLMNLLLLKPYAAVSAKKKGRLAATSLLLF